jgi:hypothetical protein
VSLKYYVSPCTCKNSNVTSTPRNKFEGTPMAPPLNGLCVSYEFVLNVSLSSYKLREAQVA